MRIVPSYRSAQEVNARASSAAEFKVAGMNSSESPEIIMEPLGIPI